jgi:predicted nucleic acid-binding protein
MAYCADTNVLLRWAQPETPASLEARAAVKKLHIQGQTVYVTPQNLVEFWTVATRPTAVNGLQMTTARAEAEMANIEKLFPLLPDTASIHEEWRRIVVETGGMRSAKPRCAHRGFPSRSRRVTYPNF